MRNKFFIYLIFIPLLSFSGCPEECPPCIDKYYVSFTTGFNYSNGEFFKVEKLCKIPTFSISAYDAAGSKLFQILSVSQPINNPITGFCADQNFASYLAFVRVDQLNLLFIGKGYKTNNLFDFFPWIRNDNHATFERFCVQMEIIREVPTIELIKPCNGINVKIPLSVKKSIITNKPLTLEDCSC